MPKFKKSLIFFLIIYININSVFADYVRTYDFNNTSDLTNYFNPDDDPTFTNESLGGLDFSGSIRTQYGIEEIWTSKKGFNTTGVGDTFKITGYFYNDQTHGYGNIGFTNNPNNIPDTYGSPVKGVGFIFHGGGSYLVNNRVNSDYSWGADLELNTWYKVTLVAENMGANKFVLTYTIYKSNEVGDLISFKDTQVMEVTNPDLAAASKLYAYFGTADTRFYRIDDIAIELTNATFEERGEATLTTSDASNITTTSAMTGGEVTSEFGSSVTTRGICYSTTSAPAITGVCESGGSGLGSFTVELTGLSSDTLYYFQSFAINSNGTSYGPEKTFTTLGENNNQNSSTRNVFKKDKRCHNITPPPISWIKLKSTSKNGISGIELSWSQNDADKISIFIDNGTGLFPYKLENTDNDGLEFLPNVMNSQKIKLVPSNGCKKGNPTISISKDSFPYGYYFK